MADENAFLIDIDLGNQGGRIRIKDPDRLDKWIEREYSVWEWLTARGDGGPPGNISTHLNSYFQSLGAVSTRVRNAHTTPVQANSEFQNIFVGNPASHFYSQGETGQAILAIREASGDEKAALAYSLMAGIRGFEPRQTQHFQLLTQVSNPGLLSGEARRNASRASYRGIVSELQELTQKQFDELKRLERTTSETLAAATNKADEQFKRGLHHYAKARKRGWKKTQQAIESIYATEKVFAEDMKLKSAVSYWEAKRNEHKNEESSRSTILLRFIRRSAVVGALIYLILFLVMLEMSGVNSVPYIDLTPDGNTPLPATSFVIIAVTLGAILTGLVWATRILVRNYQTERHLKIDAEERRVMTMTYLALVNEGSAIAEEDRLVILNALFRQATDGGPKDEPTQEVALPALLAKLMDRR